LAEQNKQLVEKIRQLNESPPDPTAIAKLNEEIQTLQKSLDDEVFLLY